MAPMCYFVYADLEEALDVRVCVQTFTNNSPRNINSLRKAESTYKSLSAH